ncbi:hypothetical protein FA15DRAFT_579807 [Coprinopsis marcescibilis]|uniref:Uncharacterized protein n=1 Tax=Coprinopsis marcescibilis TaxID=230819 RepID=A0A5C3LBG1_COPMA|nr:hypothetical protein FA15DRAFT_579807 [Coprinopsis marcescibilis]
MPVEELIRLFESPSAKVDGTEAPTNPNSNGQAAAPNSTLAPLPARFIRHIRTETSVNGLRKAESSAKASNGPLQERKVAPRGEQRQDRRSGLPRSSAIQFAEEHGRLLEHTYPPNAQGRSKVTPTESDRTNTSTTQTSSNRSNSPSHLPIPATTVFSRNAIALLLPRLDAYISSLPKHEFLRQEDLDKKDEGGRPRMFPPMDRLKELKTTLEDLEYNSTITPTWRNRKTILRSTMNVAIGFLGSSALASFYSLQGLVNTVQVFALILSTIVPRNADDVWGKWRTLFLGTIPNILALNFASTLIQSLLYLVIFMSITACFLWYFYRSTLQCDRYNTLEGLQQTESQGSQWGLVIVTFLLTVIYLPLSTMALHVVVWSEELWPVKNPYINTTTFPPSLDLLGPMAEYRDPLDFCWTTTMKRNEVNYAPILVSLGVIVFLILAIWFPLALRRVIEQSVPKVEKHSSMGRIRSSADMDAEYHRLLERDRNPFAFLYSAFRRGWGTYESTYLFAKLSTLAIIAIIDSNNCIFRSYSRTTIPVVRQIILLISTTGFFMAQCIYAPFLDPVNNASEWTSRLNYVTTSTTALLISLNVPNKHIIDTYVLYSIYILTYGLGFYFSAINLGIMQRAVKRLTRRIDFSVDIFSPRLDVSPSSVHIKRRIWQESVTTLLLTDADCQIPSDQPMSFAQAQDNEYPPYLLDFRGTPGERHAENMKILRETGDMGYKQAVSLLNGPDYAWYRYLEEQIQKHFVGPDSYWHPPSEESGVWKSYFGNAWWIPFPPTLVMRYDSGGTAVLRSVSDLDTYITQNYDPDIQRRKQVRLSLRALDGQRVYWPYEHRKVSSSSSWLMGRRGKYTATTSVHYKSCVFRIRRNGFLLWKGLHLGSGFEAELIYGRRMRMTGDVIGLNDEFDLTSPLAKFLELNRLIIEERMPQIEEALASYRKFHREECLWKVQVLSYRFHGHVYTQPCDPTGLPQSSIEFEQDPRVRELVLHSESVFRCMYDRYTAVTTSEVSTWWYLFWDDLWRRNQDTIAELNRYQEDFNPHYSTSIAYTPLPRPVLESFLTQRGLLHKKPRMFDFFHSGFLNKLYVRLNDCVFRDSQRAVMFHLGHDRQELDMEDIDILTQGNPSTLGTGGGTDHDVSWIRTRPTYRWEGLLTDPVRTHDWGQRKWFSKLGAWFGLTPIWRTGIVSQGLSLDVRVESGKYVLLDDASTVHTSTRADISRR